MQSICSSLTEVRRFERVLDLLWIFCGQQCGLMWIDLHRWKEAYLGGKFLSLCATSAFRVYIQVPFCP
jgi:hypothetical protein